MEIVEYNHNNKYAYSINGVDGVLVAIPFTNLTSTDSLVMLDGKSIDIKKMVEGKDDSFTYGDMTSVAVSPDGTKLAVALQDANYKEDGRVVLFDCKEDGNLEFNKMYKVGVQPDMLTFTPDGKKILTADEGEPRDGFGADTTDPKGTVSIVDINTEKIKIVDFTKYDTQEEINALLEKNIILGKKGDTFKPSVDLEPEYIVCTNTTAYIALQEANAIAILDIEKLEIKGIHSVGFQDYSKVKVDLVDDGKYNPSTFENLLGARMPDGIALYTIGDKDYILTANEGDAREWGKKENKFSNETNAKVVGKLDDKDVLVKLLSTEFNEGLPENKNVMLGGRSFTIFEVKSDSLKEIYDSQDDFEKITANELPDYFNVSNTNLKIDSRSKSKGPEPETVVTGKVGDKTYAYVALERIGGIMVYDITNPEKAKYVNYINSRDFSTELGKDSSPEGLYFIKADYSPTNNAMLLAACEVGGTVVAYDLKSFSTPPAPYVPQIPLAQVKLSFNVNGGSPVPAVSFTQYTTVALDAYKTSREGYKFEGWYKDESLNNEVTELKIASDTTLFAKWTKLEDEKTMVNPFKDVNSEAFYYKQLLELYNRGLVKGTSDNTFSPNVQTKRAMLVTILYRLEASSYKANSKFEDVKEGDYFANAVAWAEKNKIVNGLTESTFGPNEVLTREQLTTMLYRYASYKSLDVSKKAQLEGFIDSKNLTWSKDAMSWAVGNSIMNGTSGNTLSPQETATRAQLVALLGRFIELIK